jgi:hypothetical protein
MSSQCSTWVTSANVSSRAYTVEVGMEVKVQGALEEHSGPHYRSVAMAVTLQKTECDPCVLTRRVGGRLSSTAVDLGRLISNIVECFTTSVCTRTGTHLA